MLCSRREGSQVDSVTDGKRKASSADVTCCNKMTYSRMRSQGMTFLYKSRPEIYVLARSYDEVT